MNIIIGILIPFAGTTLGAACVFLLRNKIKDQLNKALLGFASGVMVAAAVWSLLLPSIESSQAMERFAFIPAATGLALGMAFLLLLDRIIPHMHRESDKPEGLKSSLGQNTMLVLAVTLHNIPEGMAVGVVFAGLKTGNSNVTLAGAMALAIGIAVQNFPEGAIISMPLKNEGKGAGKAFLYGTLSGVVEPVAAFITVLLTRFIVPVLPYLLAFAAGAMLYVVVEELIPESTQGEHSNIGPIGFGVGFIVMMVFDVALG